MINFVRSRYTKKINLNDILVFLVIVLITVVLANTLVNNPGMSMTPWLKTIAIIGGLCLIIAFLKGPGILELRTALLERPTIDLKNALLVISLSFLVGLVILNAQLYLLLWIIIITVAGMLSFSIYNMLTGKAVYSICLYILSWPFIAFVKDQIEGFLRKIPNFNLELFNLEVLLLLIFTFAWLIAQFFTKKTFKKDTFNLAVFLFAIVTFITVIFSLNPGYSMRCYLFEVIYPILIYFVILNSAKKRKDIEKILLAIAITVVLHLSFGFYYYVKYYSASNPYILQTYRMVSAREIIQIGFPITFGLIIMSKNGLYKTIFSVFLAVELFVLIYTGGRGALISVAICLLIFLMIKKSRRYAAVLLGGALLLTFLSIEFIKPYWGDLMALTSKSAFLSDTSIQNRLNGWRAGVNMFKDNPIYGVGPGMYEEEYFKYGPLIFNPITRVRDISMVNAHNMFITVLAERGIIGILPVVLLLTIIIQRTIYLLKKSKYNMLEITISLPILVYLYQFSLRGDTLGIFVDYPLDGGLLRWIIFALIIAMVHFSRKTSKSSTQ